MKSNKQWFTLTILFAITAIVAAVSVIYAFRPPQLVCVNGNVYDFGTIDEHETVTKEFVIANNGGKVLIVKGVKKSCGCTKAVIDKKILKKGDTAKLKITYQARPLRQKEKIDVLLVTNDPQNPYSRFVVQGFVKPRIFWYPQSLSFMSNVSINDVLTKKIHLIIDDDKLGIDDIELTTSSDYIVPGSIEKEEDGFSLDVSLNPTCPLGTWTEIVKLSYNETDETKEVKVPVYIMKK